MIGVSLAGSAAVGWAAAVVLIAVWERVTRRRMGHGELLTVAATLAGTWALWWALGARSFASLAGALHCLVLMWWRRRGRRAAERTLGRVVDLGHRLVAAPA